MKKKLVSLLCVLALCLGLLPVTAGAEDTKVNYIYYTWNGSTLEQENGTHNATAVTADNATWGGSDSTEHWYVVNSSFTIGSRVTVTGDVHLILADGCTLTVNRGIRVAQGNSLTIYGQSGDSGTLIAQNPSIYNAGIGGNKEQTAGTVTIHGGRVTATGVEGGAGIGGGDGGDGGTVTIYGGRVEATGGALSAGIGGGTVTIHGGTVEATGGNHGAGIGGGSYDGGTPGDSGTFSTGQSGNAVIFASSIADNDDTNGWRGVIFQGNEGQVYGSVALDQDLTIENGRTLTIPENSALDIQDGVTLTVEQGGNLTVAEGGTVNNYGTVENSGTLLVYGTLNGTVVGSGTVTYKVTGVSLDQNTLDLTVGSTETLIATITPGNATNKNLTWTSGDEDVATVNNGVVTATGTGTTNITVTTADGSKQATCSVTVTQPVTGVKLDQTELSLFTGGSATLGATVEPETATNKKTDLEKRC